MSCKLRTRVNSTRDESVIFTVGHGQVLDDAHVALFIEPDKEYLGYLRYNASRRRDVVCFTLRVLVSFDRIPRGRFLEHFTKTLASVVREYVDAKRFIGFRRPTRPVRLARLGSIHPLLEFWHAFLENVDDTKHALHGIVLIFVSKSWEMILEKSQQKQRV
jgi:hypothetical protein